MNPFKILTPSPQHRHEDLGSAEQLERDVRHLPDVLHVIPLGGI
jgi:hypothetical protein